MKLKYLLLSVLSVLLITASCSKDENMTIPSIKLETAEVSFGTAASSQTIEFYANRAWTATWDSDWIAVEPLSGDASDKLQTVTVSVLNNAGYDRTGNVKITMTYDYKTVTIKQTGERGPATEQTIFFNNFDKEAATQTYGSGTSWPYLDQFEGWKNESGTGIEGVNYSFNAVSARNNSNSNGNYSDYAGSGTNNLLFGANGYFCVKNLALASGVLDYTISFGAEQYVTNASDNTFDPSKFHVYISADMTKWVELTYTFPNGLKNGRWDLAHTTFTLPEGTTELGIYIKSDLASGHRLDDLKLEVSLNSGTPIDFTNGVELDDNGGGGGGGGTDNAIYFNNFDKEVATQTFGSGNSWPYTYQFDGWKNETGSGATGVEYTGYNVSCRANSASNGSYSVYNGSGGNNLFFGANKNVFKIKKIALNGETSFKLTFGTEKYQQSGSVFNPSEFHVYVGKDTLKWVELTYSFPNGNQDGKWDLATAEFQIPAGTTNLCFYITADVASAYRLDDVTLVQSDATPTTQSVNFDNGVALDDGNGGGSGGGGGGTGTYKYKKATSITSGKAYLLVASATAAPSGKESNVGTWAGKPVAAGKNYDYLQKDAVTISGDEITMTATDDEFVFTVSSDPTAVLYTIKQSDDRYLYKANDNYNNFNVNATPASGQYWSVSFNNDGTATITNTVCNKWIQFSSNYGSYGCYSSAQENGYLPVLYEREGEGGSGGGGGGNNGGGGSGDGNYDVVLSLGANMQSWSSTTDNTYGAGYTASTQDLTVSYFKHTSTTNPVAPSDDHVRVYKNSVIVISPASSTKKIKSIKLETTATNYCANLAVLSDNSTATASGTEITWSSSAGVQTFIGHATSAQVRVKKISVEFAD